MDTAEILSTIKEATGHSARILPTGGGCEVLAWESTSGMVCWLSDDDARIPTDETYGLVLGIYRPGTDKLWPCEDGTEDESFFYAATATPSDLASLLVDAREVAR